MLPLMAGDGAQHPRNLLAAPEFSIVSLAVCAGCPTRYALTMINGGMIIRQLDDYTRWTCAQDARMQVVCPRCLGTMSIYVPNAAEVADGRHIELSEKLSEKYWMN